jgi:SAM-dependent methyltransferase
MQRLRRFHESNPGITRRALARGRDERGRSSYQLLAELAAPAQRVLDLGCGDGELLELLRRDGRAARALGVDRAAAEVALARRAGLAVARAEAAALPCPSRCFDLVLSHLAFSIMDEIEAVVAEIDRVLTATGQFAAVVGGGPVAAAPQTRHLDAFEPFLAALSRRLRGAARCRFGDPRAGHLDGWRALWAPRGFVVRERRHELDLSGSFAEVWTTLASAYDCMLLAPAELRELQRELGAWCAQTALPGQRIPLRMVTWLLVATRG